MTNATWIMIRLIRTIAKKATAIHQAICHSAAMMPVKVSVPLSASIPRVVLRTIRVPLLRSAFERGERRDLVLSRTETDILKSLRNPLESDRFQILHKLQQHEAGHIQWKSKGKRGSGNLYGEIDRSYCDEGCHNQQQAGVASGELRSDLAIPVQAQMLTALVQGLMVEWHLHPGRVNWQHVAEETVRSLRSSGR